MSNGDMHHRSDAPADGPTFEVLRPNPAGTIQTLTALGYTPEAAIADIVDNSIAASAANIAVKAGWDGAERSWVAVVDDGTGMDEDSLLRGLTLGEGGLAPRTGVDLGRFGMGLKTASFSQARQLVVASRPALGDWSTRTWDVDHVLDVGEWQLMRGAPPEVADRLDELKATVPGSGTVVLWRRLTRLVSTGSQPGDEGGRQAFHGTLARVEDHLGMVFSRYLQSAHHRIRITLNDREVEPWDPFLPGYPQVEGLAPETPVPGVRVQGFVLPHRSRLSETQHERGGGPRGWLDQQGFYVYRQDRLIVAGDWLNIGRFRKDEKHTLARVMVQLPREQDLDWALDVKKSSATPPPHLLSHLRRVGKVTRERAGAVINHRGKVVRDTQSRPEDFTWKQVAQHGEKRFLINRDHALIRGLLDNHPEARDAVRAVLSMVETTLPVGTIRSTPEATVESSANGSDEAPQQMVDLASKVLESLLARHVLAAEAVQRVIHMPPFTDYPGILAHLDPDPPPSEAGRTP